MSSLMCDNDVNILSIFYSALPLSLREHYSETTVWWGLGRAVLSLWLLSITAAVATAIQYDNIKQGVTRNYLYPPVNIPTCNEQILVSQYTRKKRYSWWRLICSWLYLRICSTKIQSLQLVRWGRTCHRVFYGCKLLELVSKDWTMLRWYREQ